MKINCEPNRRLKLKSRQINYLGYASEMIEYPLLSKDMRKLSEIWQHDIRKRKIVKRKVNLIEDLDLERRIHV